MNQQNWECMICKQLPNEVRVTNCCTNLICLQCYENCKKVKWECCICRTKNFTVKAEEYLTRLVRERSSQITVKVQTMTRGCIILKMRQLDPAKFLYNRVSERVGVQVNQLSLNCKGKTIKNDQKTLKTYDIQDKDTVFHLSRMNGGQ